MMSCHRNLNARSTAETWSYRPVSGSRVSRASFLILKHVVVKQPSGKLWERLKKGGARGVCTWFRAVDYIANIPCEIPPNAVRIHFNPRSGELYHQAPEGMRVDRMKECYLTDKGEAWGEL